MPDPKSITLNAFLMSTGHHEASWRLPGADPRVSRDVTYFQGLARTAERGKMDSVFFADSPSLMTEPGRRPSETLEPAMLLAAMAVATERIGLVATASTTYDDPYNLARSFASLDAISKGRAAWNLVTSADLRAGANFGHTTSPSHAERYERAEEFLDVVLALWDSWAQDAVVADKATGVWADPGRIEEINHVGEHFRVAGPLTVGRSPQGRPVIVQAGSSGPGIALAARGAEAVFTAQPTIEEGRAFYRQLKDATVAAGRSRDDIRILPGLVPILGSTEAEARDLERQLDELVVLDHPLRQLAKDTGVPVEQLDLDQPLPRDIRPVSEIEGGKARYELVVDMARRDELTVRELLLRLGSGRGHRAFVGTPEQVADTIQEWVSTGAADGFNIMPAVLPSGLELFVDQVVPILQQRGLFRHDYTGSTLRDHYGLAAPSADVPTERGSTRQTA